MFSFGRNGGGGLAPQSSQKPQPFSFGANQSLKPQQANGVVDALMGRGRSPAWPNSRPSVSPSPLQGMFALGAGNDQPGNVNQFAPTSSPVEARQERLANVQVDPQPVTQPVAPATSSSPATPVQPAPAAQRPTTANFPPPTRVNGPNGLAPGVRAINPYQLFY